MSEEKNVTFSASAKPDDSPLASLVGLVQGLRVNAETAKHQKPASPSARAAAAAAAAAACAGPTVDDDSADDDDDDDYADDSDQAARFSRELNILMDSDGEADEDDDDDGDDVDEEPDPVFAAMSDPLFHKSAEYLLMHARQVMQTLNKGEEVPVGPTKLTQAALNEFVFRYLWLPAKGEYIDEHDKRNWI